MKAATEERIKVIEATVLLENQFLLAAHQRYKYFGERKGQALMNGLSDVAPELYDILSGSLVDCFYEDAKIDNALAELGFSPRRFHHIMSPSI